jgi:predicted dehydrogenase
MGDKIRFGIIGGGMAGPLNAGALRDIPEAEVVAFCDVKEDVAKEFSKEYNIPSYYTDYKEMLKRDDIDAVCVVTPPFLHEQMVVDCAKAGKHVMCEKPISVDCNAADRMIAACKEAGVKFGVIFMYRFMDQAQLIKKALDEGKLGKLLSVDCSGKCFRSDEYYASGAWRGTWKGEGGGSLISQTVHFIDLMLYLVGDVERLTGNYMTTLHPDIEVDDVANAIFKFKNGALGSLVSSSAVRPGYPRHIEIHGEKGTIKIVEEEKVDDFAASVEEDLTDFLSEKVIAMEPGKLIVDKVVQEAQRKLADSMFGMMLGGSFIEKIAGQIQEGIDAYIAENARGYIEKEVVAASEELQAKPIPEVTGFFEEKGIYDPEFLWRLYKRIIEEKLPALLSSLKLSAVVEERINAMKVEEVEELVLSIMSKELGAIVNLGAVIGLILGLVNVLIFII